MGNVLQGGAAPTVRIGRPVLPAQAQMQLELCRQLQDGHCSLVASQRISWLQVCCYFSLLSLVLASAQPQSTLPAIAAAQRIRSAIADATAHATVVFQTVRHARPRALCDLGALNPSARLCWVILQPCESEGGCAGAHHVEQGHRHGASGHARLCAAPVDARAAAGVRAAGGPVGRLQALGDGRARLPLGSGQARGGPPRPPACFQVRPCNQSQTCISTICLRRCCCCLRGSQASMRSYRWQLGLGLRRSQCSVR